MRADDDRISCHRSLDLTEMGGAIPSESWRVVSLPPIEARFPPTNNSTTGLDKPPLPVAIHALCTASFARARALGFIRAGLRLQCNRTISRLVRSGGRNKDLKLALKKACSPLIGIAKA
jgi:hypothetical protein